MCYKPITCRLNGQVVTIPCGKCLSCVQRYQRDWSFRLDNEYSQWSRCYFLTLTYRNDAITWSNIPDSSSIPRIRERVRHLPVSKSLSYARSRDIWSTEYLRPDKITERTLFPVVNRYDVCSWLKQCRRHWSRAHSYVLDGKRKYPNMPFKYFLCSEYGPSTLRPHYHIILFTNFTVYEIHKYFCARWERRFGRVDWKFNYLLPDKGGKISSVSSYVSKYCCKPSFIESPYVVEKAAAKPFRLCSHGIGSCGRDYYKNLLSSYVLDYFRAHPLEVSYSEDFLRGFSFLCSYFRAGILFPLPRYWRDKCFPQVLKCRRRYSPKEKTVKIIKVYEKSSVSPLWLAYKNYLQDQHFKRLQQDALALGAYYDDGARLVIPPSVESLMLENDRQRRMSQLKKARDFYLKKLATSVVC